MAKVCCGNEYGNELKRSKRFQFGEKIGAHTRHLLLMTATPHNGKEEDFQLFLSLLDSDRFYGKFRDGVHSVDVKDIMRRMVKEDLLKFDGTKLFPERRANSVKFELSKLESILYSEVTEYVQHEMNRADSLNEQNKRKNTVGFALTLLQRRLASSPLAIYRSLQRRKCRLEEKIREGESVLRGKSFYKDISSAMLVIPAGLLARLSDNHGFTADAETRQQLEKIGMDAVMQKEMVAGNEVFDVSKEHPLGTFLVRHVTREDDVSFFHFRVGI